MFDVDAAVVVVGVVDVEVDVDVVVVVGVVDVVVDVDVDVPAIVVANKSKDTTRNCNQCDEIQKNLQENELFNELTNYTNHTDRR